MFSSLSRKAEGGFDHTYLNALDIRKSLKDQKWCIAHHVKDNVSKVTRL